MTRLGYFRKVFGIIFSRPSIWQLFVVFKKPLFYAKNTLAMFWATLAKIGRLTILASGHTVVIRPILGH